MRLHEALYWYHNGRGTDQQKVAIATLMDWLRARVQRKQIVGLATDDAMQEALIRLRRVRPDCAKQLLADEEAVVADKQTAAYCRQVVRSITADFLRRKQRAKQANADPEEQAAPAAPPTRDTELQAQEEEIRLLQTKVAERLAVRRDADPDVRARVRSEVARDVAEMLALAMGTKAVSELIGLDPADPAFRTARDALYQRHKRTRDRLRDAVTELARLQRGVGGRPLLDADTAASLNWTLKLLQRRRTDRTQVAVRSSQPPTSTNRVDAPKPTPEVYPQKDAMATKAIRDQVVATDRIPPPLPNATPQGFAATASAVDFPSLLEALQAAVTRGQGERTLADSTALAASQLVAAPFAQAHGWVLRTLRSARDRLMVYRSDAAPLQAAGTTAAEATGVLQLDLSGGPAVHELWTAQQPQQGLRLTALDDGALQVEVLQRQEVTPWSPPALATLSAPPLQEWVGSDSWLAQKVNTLQAGDALDVLIAVGQTFRLAQLEVSGAQALEALLANEPPQLAWMRTASPAALARAAELLCTAAAQLHEALMDLLDDEALSLDEGRAARTALLRWRDDLQAAYAMLRVATPDPAQAIWHANVRDALADVDLRLQPLCEIWDDDDVLADEQLERAASLDPDAWWARAGDPLWAEVAELDDLDEEDD